MCYSICAMTYTYRAKFLMEVKTCVDGGHREGKATQLCGLFSILSACSPCQGLPNLCPSNTNYCSSSLKACFLSRSNCQASQQDTAGNLSSSHTLPLLCNWLNLVDRSHTQLCKIKLFSKNEARYT